MQTAVYSAVARDVMANIVLLIIGIYLTYRIGRETPQ